MTQIKKEELQKYETSLYKTKKAKPTGFSQVCRFRRAVA